MPQKGPEPVSVPRPISRARKVGDWLESPYLRRIVLRVAYERGLPPQDVPELMQEVRIALWRSGLESQVNATWLFHTATHKAQDLLRRTRGLAMKASFSTDFCLQRGRSDPELLRLLRARAALLPPPMREFYLLRYLAGLSERQMGERLGICRGSIRGMERRCLKMLKGRRVGL